jgi:hypothetical protein
MIRSFAIITGAIRLGAAAAAEARQTNEPNVAEAGGEKTPQRNIMLELRKATGDCGTASV